MRKRQMLKQAVFVAICVTIIVIWQRQWLTDDAALYDTDTATDNQGDNVLSEVDRFGMLSGFKKRQRIPQNDLPIISQQHMQNSTSEFSAEGRNRKDFEPTTKGNDVNAQEDHDIIEQKDVYPDEVLQVNKTENRNSDINNKSKSKMQTTEISKHPNFFRTTIKAQGNSKVPEDALQTPRPFPYSVSSERHMTEPESRAPDKDDKFKPLADSSNNDDDLAKLLWQKDFHRHEEELPPQNVGVNLGHGEKDQVGKMNATKGNQKTKSDWQVRENVLKKTNRSNVHDDRKDFFGKMPSFDDYDLPILNSPSQNGGNVTKNMDKLSSSTTTERTNKDVQIEENGEDDPGVGDKMEGLIILGHLNATKKYAVFSATTDGRNSLSYIFYLPLTVLAWKRVGFESVVIIVGAKDEWDADPLLFHVLSTVRRLGCVVMFLEPRPEKSVMISQVARIFAANILRSVFPGIDDTYFVTSDADLWPIYGDIYNLPQGKQILSLNSACCSPFKHRGSTYKMLPMANVGMTARTWRKITRRFGESAKTIDDILTHFVQEFGTVALRPVHKGDNIGWFLDQMMVSILIAKWIEQHGSDSVKFVPRDVGVDRIDRAGWSYSQDNIDEKVDAHLLLEAYIPGVWVRVTHLLRAMYGDMSERYVWCVDYYEEFQKLFLTKYRSKQT